MSKIYAIADLHGRADLMHQAAACLRNYADTGEVDWRKVGFYHPGVK